MSESEIRISMARLRRNRTRQGDIKCDLCGVAPYSERHHIIQKSATIGRDEARELANGPKITALLCKSCHEIVDLPLHRDRLFANLYKINGKGDVLAGWLEMKKIFDQILEKGVVLFWTLPKPN